MSSFYFPHIFKKCIYFQGSDDFSDFYKSINVCRKIRKILSYEISKKKLSKA